VIKQVKTTRPQLTMEKLALI